MTVTIKQGSGPARSAPAGSGRRKVPAYAEPVPRSEVAEPVHLLDFESVYKADPMAHIAWIRQGVRAGQVGEMAARLDTTQDQLMKRLGLPRATVVRKTRSSQNLPAEQAERVLGLSKLIGQVQTMVDQSGDPEGFDAAHWVGRWLERPNAALGGRPPAELMDTVTGQELVSALLRKMQSGAFA